jgi:hypothetical protein
MTIGYQIGIFLMPIVCIFDVENIWGCFWVCLCFSSMFACGQIAQSVFTELRTT